MDGCACIRLQPHHAQRAYHPLSASQPCSSSGIDSPEPPITPDHSDNGEEGSDTAMLPCSDHPTESMESAMQTLLEEAGIVSDSSSHLKTSIRRYVMSLLASTMGYHQQVPCRQLSASSSTMLLDDPQPAPSNSRGCCCSNTSSTSSHHCNGKMAAAASSSTAMAAGAQWHEHHVCFMSQCEHHMLPFYGTVHIAYPLPSSSSSRCSKGRNCGHACSPAPLSDAEVEQLVSTFTQRLQVQERITQQVATAVQQVLAPAGVMVVVRAAHMCMVARGVENHAGTTVTRAVEGVFAQQAALRVQFLKTATAQGTAMMKSLS
jgi:GTP cyclohydrolase I